MHTFFILSSGQNVKAEAGTAYETEPDRSPDSQRNNTTLKRKLNQSDSGHIQNKACRTTYSVENPFFTLPPSLPIEPKPDLSLTDEHQLPSTSPHQKQAPTINGYHITGSINLFNKMETRGGE